MAQVGLTVKLFELFRREHEFAIRNVRDGAFVRLVVRVNCQVTADGNLFAARMVEKHHTAAKASHWHLTHGVQHRVRPDNDDAAGVLRGGFARKPGELVRQLAALICSCAAAQYKQRQPANQRAYERRVVFHR
ncbi:MAG: hypothetical protein KDA63_21525 [Planctomycetales bacterium]|nr:hypothetical protein [Planctomycetales bacterium]